ncbi:Tyrosine-protein phosphatase non-receptor type 23, partial [Stegodyphus mimosarum]
MTNALVSSYDAYDDLILKIKKGLEFYQKLQTNVTRLLTRIRSVTKVQDEERSQMITADLRKGSKIPPNTSVNVSSEQHVPKLKDYLQFFPKRGAVSSMPAVPYNGYPSTQVQSVPSVTPQFVTEPMRQATLGGPASAEFDRKLKPAALDSTRKDENLEISSIGVRPTPVGSEQTSIPAMCTTALSNADVGRSSAQPQHWPQAMTPSATFSGYGAANIPYQHPAVTNSQPQLPSSATFTSLRDPNLQASQTYSSMPLSSNSNTTSLYYNDKLNFASPQLQGSVSAAVVSSAGSSSTVTGSIFQSIPTSVAYPYNNNIFASAADPSSSVSLTSMQSVGYSATNIGQKSDNFATIRSPVNASVPQYGGVSQFSNNVLSVASSNMPTFGQHVVSPSSAATSQISYQHQVYPSAEQSKLFHSSSGQQNQYHLPQGNQFTPPPGYILPSATYDPRIQANTSYDPRIQTGVNNYHPSVQYYHASGSVVQAGQSSVTASMDTRTNTFSTVNPYSFANPPSSDQPQQIPSSHVMNSSDVKMYMTPNTIVTNSQISSSVKTIPQTSFSSMNAVAPPGTTMYSSVAPNSFQSTIANASVACSGGQSTYQNVPSPPNQFSSPVSQQPSGSAYSGTVVNTPGSIGYQHLVTQQSNVPSTLQSVPLPYSGNAYATQQPFQPAVDPLSKCSMTSANGIYNSNNSIPNQQLPIPIEPIPLVPSPPVQPAAVSETSQSVELKSPAPVVLSSTYTESQLKTVSDTITPQPKPNTADATEAKIELTAQSLEPKLMDIKDIAPLREKESMQFAKDPLDDPSVRSKFVSEVEKYEKFVDGLVRKSLNGTTPLDQKWK